MIPILYEEGTTTFTNNGIGRLVDCISCLVYEERNGIFEVEFEYGITGKYYSEIREGRIITVSHDEQKDKQPFIIYGRSAEISGIVKFYAHHISYLLSNIIVEPFTAVSVADAFNTFIHSNMNTNPFTFWTDNVTGGTMNIEIPSTIRSVMGGSQGSILDVFGGEYKFDNFLVRNYASRGNDPGVTIRYGKNLVQLNQSIDAEYLYNAVVPYWTDNQSTVVYGAVTAATGQTASLVSTLDMSQDFMEQPTVAQLNSAAQSWLDRNTPWIPKENIKIDFVALWQTEEYKNIAPLERVQLCDTVTVYYPELGVEATAKVIKVVWDALLERYDSIELGDARSTFADTVLQEATADIGDILEGVPTRSFIQEAIDHATELITGGLGGHIIFLYDANGKPTDMLVMDTEDIATAVHVLRINVNGIGFSSTGSSGPFTSAWTLDGAFVADFITAGTMAANRIKGGTLSLGGSTSGIGGNGVLVVYDANDIECGRLDTSGIVLKQPISSSAYSQSKLNSITYYNFVGNNTLTAYGLQIAYIQNSAIKTYSANIVRSSDIVEYAYLPIGGYWQKQIYIGSNTSGHGLYWQFYNNTFYVSAKDRGTPSDGSWDPFSVSINNMSITLQDATIDTSDTQFKLTLGKQSGNTDCYMQLTRNGTTGIWAGVNQYIRYNGTYWYLYDTEHYGKIATQGSSSRRYKHDITNQIGEKLAAHKLYELKMVQFVYNDDSPTMQYPDMKGRTLPGFIAEDVAEIYPAAVIHDADGNIENWDERRIIPGMLKLIQEQHEEIEDLKQRLAKLEKLVETLI